MLINEIVAEAGYPKSLGRRGFLKTGLAVPASLAISKYAQSAPYVDVGDLTPEQGAFYEKQISMLEHRGQQILWKLKEVIAERDPQNLQKVDKVKLEVFFQRRLAAAHLDKQKILLDVTVYHDINNDALACTIGHELGHFVYGTSRYHNDAHAMELDADLYGIKMAQYAGYDIRQALRGLAEAGDFFSRGGKSHPSYDQRIQAVRKAGYPTAGTGYNPPKISPQASSQLSNTSKAIQVAAQSNQKAR